MIFEERQIEKNNFSSRAILLFGLIILSLLVVLIKVFSLQVSGYSDYQLAALKNKNYAVAILDAPKKQKKEKKLNLLDHIKLYFRGGLLLILKQKK